MSVSPAEMAIFCERHYRVERLNGRGASYAAHVIASQLDALDRFGESYISQWESYNGEPVRFTAAVVKDFLTTGPASKKSVTAPTCNDNLHVRLNASLGDGPRCMECFGPVATKDGLCDTCWAERQSGTVSA